MKSLKKETQASAGLAKLAPDVALTMTAEFELKEGNNKSHAEREPTTGLSFWSGDVNERNTTGSA